jgi:AAA15 family ATPase/GTPase
MLEIEIKLHNTFSSLIPKLIVDNINNDGTEHLITLLEKMYEDGVSWDLKKGIL